MSKIAKLLWTMVVMAVCMLGATLALGAPASQPAKVKAAVVAKAPAKAPVVLKAPVVAKVAPVPMKVALPAAKAPAKAVVVPDKASPALVKAAMLKVAAPASVSASVPAVVATVVPATTATVMPASQPASAPVVGAVPVDNLAALAQVIIGAINARNWPVIVVCLLVIALFVERHFKGLTGNKFSAWLGTKLGLLVSSLFTAVVTAAAGVAAQGWKAIGNACVAAVVVGALNFVAQFAGPATKVDAAAGWDHGARGAD